MEQNEKVVRKKASRLCWRQDGDKLTSEMSVTRQPFGEFTIRFSMPVGQSGVTVLIDAAYGLSAPKESYDNLESAIIGIVKYFDEIDRKRLALPMDICDVAQRAYNRVIASAMEKRG